MAWGARDLILTQAQGHLPHAVGGDAQPRGGAAGSDAVGRAPRGADADGEPLARRRAAAGLPRYFLFNVYVILDAIPQTNVPGPSGI